MEGANEFEVEDMLNQIYALNNTFTAENPLTYAVLEYEFGDKLNEPQKELVEKFKQKALRKEQHYNKIMGEYMRRLDAQLAEASVLDKIGDTDQIHVSDECIPYSKECMAFTGIKIPECASDK